MYKVLKNGDYFFYSPKEQRKTSITEIVIIIIAIAITYMTLKSRTIGRTISLSVICIYFLSRYVAPVLSKKYNATVTNKDLILDNVESKSVHLPIQTIDEIKKENEMVVFVSGNKNSNPYAYRITMENQDIDEFVNVVLKRKNEYLDSIRSKINIEINKNSRII